MVHIIEGKNGQTRWVTVGKKGNTFEVLGKNSEQHTQDHNNLKNIKANMKVWNSSRLNIIDHTGKGLKWISISEATVNNFTTKRTTINPDAIQAAWNREIAWVKENLVK